MQQLQRLNYNQQIQMINGNNGNVIQTYFKIPGTCPTFMSDRLPRKDRRNIRDLVEFLGEHCIDAYVHVCSNKDYPKIDVLGLAKSSELYLTAIDYLNGNSPSSNRTLRIGKYVKGKGGKIKTQRNGLPKIKGGNFEIKLLPDNEFTDSLPKPYLGLRLIPKSFLKKSPIDIIFVSEDCFKDHKEEKEKGEEKERIWQEWLRLGSDVYYIC